MRRSKFQGWGRTFVRRTDAEYRNRGGQRPHNADIGLFTKSSLELQDVRTLRNLKFKQTIREGLLESDIMKDNACCIVILIDG